jgi:membrane protease YdiL (CAAX protease family)
LALGSIASNLISSVIPPDIRGYLLAYPVMLVATMIAIILAGRFLDRRRFIDFGLSLTKQEWWIDFTFGVVLSTVPVLIILLALQGIGWITIEGVFKSKLAGWPIVIPVIIAVTNHICVGAFEEIARVYQMRNLFESVWAKFGRWGAALLAIGMAALISVCMHLPDLELLPPIFIVYVLLDGIFLGLCYLATGRAAIAIAMHFMIDLLLLTVFVPNGSAFFDGFVTLFSIRFTNSVSTEFISTHMDFVIIIGILIYEIVNILALYAWVRMRNGKFIILDNLAVTSFLQKPVTPK